MPDKRTFPLLHAPLVEWRDRVRALSPRERMTIASDCDALAQRAVMLRTYLDHIDCEGDHAHAVTRANAALVKVRRLLGYAYPKAGEVTGW
jgi:hypothetical protein